MQSPFLHEEIASRMMARLAWIKTPVQDWAHWYPMQGGLKAHQDLRCLYPDAKVWVHPENVAEANFWQTQSTPILEKNLVDMLWVNMALHRTQNALAQIQAWERSLRPGGFLMFSTVGPDTLHELRAVYRAKGWPPPAQDFFDMHNWGDILLEVGFAEPIVDRETLVLTYETAEQEIADLRALGRNMHNKRFAACRGRHWLLALQLALPKQLSFEVIYGHAYKPLAKKSDKGYSAFPVDELRASLRKR